jgi:hypothetical protein
MMFSAASIRLPLAGWTPVDGDDSTYRNQFGDVLSLHYFPMPPDFPAPLADIAAIRSAYRRLLGKRGSIIEIEADPVGGLSALRAIFELASEASSVTYMAALMIPFRDHHFMIKVTCREIDANDQRAAALARARSHLQHTLLRAELPEAVRDLAPFDGPQNA